ncbi:MAG TPA: ABC-type transport auxiliary lipoprotein family protein [Steroidobacteraceae bacterium]|jgi:cholesterol transport system auxiliary component|nr:ABC-type transport auxiliary lipoprotein family protein [Steroidobacteraceae bacterium]
MRPDRHLRIGFASVALLICTASLGGCIGGGLHSNQPRQEEYLLRAPGAPAAADAASTAGPPSTALDAARSLEVLLPAAAPGLEGDGIAVLRPGEQLDYYTGARWAAAAPQMLQNLAIESLRQQGRFVLVESDSAPFAASWVLQLELTHFEADYQDGGPPTVQVGLIATLGQRSARQAVMTLSIDTQARAQADRMHDVVAAFQSATSQALQQISARLVPAMSPGAAHP